MMEFSVFHNYNKLVRRGMAKPLTCRHCGTQYVLRIGEDDQPVLYCFVCPVVVHPGLNMYNDVRAVVKEHFA